MSNQGGRGGFRGSRGGDGYRGDRGGDGYRGGRRSDTYRSSDRGGRNDGNRSFDRNADGCSGQMGDMNLGSQGSGYRGSSGPPRGRGGRSRTTVNWAVRKPFCQNEVKPLVSNKPLWKHFNPDQEGDIPLPKRKEGSASVRNSNRTVDIFLNHFEVFIKFPNKLYQYRADIIRKPRVPVEGAIAKPPQGNRKKSAKVVEGGEAPPKMLPADTRKRILSRVVQDMHRQYGYDYGIITDFSATLYTIRRLEEKGLPLTFEVPGAVVEEDTTGFIVAIEATVERIDTRNLEIDINNMRGQMVSAELVNLERIYSTLMRCVKLNIYTPMQRTAIIDFTQEPHPLGGGIVSYRGFDIMLPLANGWKKFINIEISNLASYLNGRVEDLLVDLFRGERIPITCMDMTSWKQFHHEKANSLLKTCKVVYSPHPARKFSKVVAGIVPLLTVSTCTFDYDGKQMSIMEYFRQTYGIKLKYPNGPVLELKGHNKPKVPAEICQVKAGQSYNRKLDETQVSRIAEKSRLTPDVLQPAIQNAVQELDLLKNPLLQAYGMTLANEGKMHQVKAKVLTPPELCYGRGFKGNADKSAVIVPENGEWDIWSTEFEFFRNCTVKKWGIVNLAGGRGYNAVQKHAAYEFACLLSRKGKMRGIDLDDKPEFYQELQLNENDGERNLNLLENVFRQFRERVDDEDLQKSFILVILPRKGTLLYNHVKQAAELRCGILTQCIVGSNTTNPKRLESICGNLWLKINSKLSKVNHVILPPPNFSECFKTFHYPTIVIGADVTHPPPGSTRTVVDRNGVEREVGPPSYAAVTASIDRTGMPYMMHIQAQTKAQKGAAEVIENLDDILVKFLNRFHQMTNRVKPCRIIYYRDGVGEGQFQEILRTEMQALRRACARLNQSYTPCITFVTVQKRHKTRFFAQAGNSVIENAPPGTVVDVDIVHPTETDFYLLSHKGLLGTSRPTRYHVLWDDSDFSMEEIQTLSYFLCYMFVRCNRSVKIPAPTYYAHWAAKRAEVLAKGAAEKWYGDILAINNYLNGGTREDITNFFPMHFV